MPRGSRLKVFRTPIGFHDAYVAAPSQKAAIEAWGSDRDVFRRGEAELVTDPSLVEEPLATPGKVVKKLRGSAAEQLAALPPNRPKRKRRARMASPPTKREKAKTGSKPPPRPSRTALDKAEEALSAAKEKQERDREALRKKEAALARERAKLEKKHAEERERLEARRKKAVSAYEQAMDVWRAS